MNIYKILLGILMGTVFAFLFSVIEYQMFNESIIGGILSNLFITTLFFLLYKSNKHNALMESDEVKNGK